MEFVYHATRTERRKENWLESVALDARLLRADGRYRRPDCTRLLDFPLVVGLSVPSTGRRPMLGLWQGNAVARNTICLACV